MEVAKNPTNRVGIKTNTKFMKKKNNKLDATGSKAFHMGSVVKNKNWTIKKIVLILMLALGATNVFAQPICPGGGWENEPIQEEDGCCILFDMLPSTPAFPWEYWFVVADGVTYNNTDNPTGEFKVCFPHAGMENVVVTYVDAAGATLCENDWTVFVEEGCIIPCEDCLSYDDILVTSEDGCDYDFTMSYTINPDCDVTIIGQTWDFGHPGGTETGDPVSHTFPSDGFYTVTGTIEYLVDGEAESCTDTRTTVVEVTECTVGGGLNCFEMEMISAEDTEMTIQLPTREICMAPTFEVRIREFGSGTPFFPASATVYSPSPDVFHADISGLDPCTPYEFQVEVYCDGLSGGLCSNEAPYVTDCPPPCSGCFIPNEIVIDEADRCEHTLTADFEFTDACGDISDVTVDWDFGFDGPGSTGTGETVDVSFLCEGTYTVTATISYTTYPDVECANKITREIEVVGCDDGCESCALDGCLDVDGISILSEDGCEYLFVVGYAVGDCGALDPASISIDWDFGHPGGTVNTGATESYTHNFPSDGTYIVTVTINYRLAGSLEDRHCTTSIRVDVTDCGGGKGDRGQISNGSGGLHNSGLTATTVPNPADDEVTITVIDPTQASDMDQLEILIFDINGRQVYNGRTNLGAATKIDVSLFESGLYIYEVRNGETIVLTEKLLIK